MLSRFEKFIIDITEIDLYWHRIASGVMRQYGLKGSHAIYFTMLYHSPDGLTAAELAAKCGKDKADVSRDVAALEAAGFVRRMRTGSNAYRALIAPTERGAELAREIILKSEQAVDSIGGELSDSDRECFYRVLDTITGNMHALSETGLPDLNENKGE